jgi:hypothetical protein
MFTTCTKEQMRQAGVEFKSQPEMEEILTRELPAFAQWLLDYEPEPQCVGDVRFGVTSYHDPALVVAAEQSSYTAGFAQVLEDWKQQYFGVLNKGKDLKFWEGTAFQLYKEISRDEEARYALRGSDANTVNRNLASLQQKGHRIEHRDPSGSLRVWRVYKDSLPDSH